MGAGVVSGSQAWAVQGTLVQWEDRANESPALRLQFTAVCDHCVKLRKGRQSDWEGLAGLC